MQPGDVYQTYADTQDLARKTGYTPKVTVKEVSLTESSGTSRVL